MNQLKGKKFGRLIAIQISGKADDGCNIWLCKCDCGNFKDVRSNRLTGGSTKSCGCLQKERRKSEFNKSHGLSKHRLYNIWSNMIQRCTKKDSQDWLNYGARGIKVCDRWLDVQNFINDMYPSYKNGLYLERINVNGNYEPKNCKWATAFEQARNKTNSQKKQSQYRGVHWDNRKKVWRSVLHLGSYKSELEAHNIYEHTRKEFERIKV